MKEVSLRFGNIIKFKSHDIELIIFLSRLYSNSFSLSIELPIDENCDNFIEKRIIKWGTRSDAFGVILSNPLYYENTGIYELQINFFTVDNPPSKWLYFVSNKYSNLEIEFKYILKPDLINHVSLDCFMHLYDGVLIDFHNNHKIDIGMRNLFINMVEFIREELFKYLDSNDMKIEEEMFISILRTIKFNRSELKDRIIQLIDLVSEKLYSDEVDFDDMNLFEKILFTIQIIYSNEIRKRKEINRRLTLSKHLFENILRNNINDDIIQEINQKLINF